MRLPALLLCLALPALAADLPAPSPPPSPPIARADPVQTGMLDARQAIQARDWKSAETALRAVLREQPRHADALNLLGFTLRWQERYEESLAAYQQALAIQPDHLGAHEYIARTYLKLGRIADAEGHWQRLRERCGDCAEAKALQAAIAGARKP
jgi:tetratricopeptide (TPR) repeat protein